MTVSEFIALCLEHDVDPAIAIEDEHVAYGLMTRDDEAVKEAMKRNF